MQEGETERGLGASRLKEVHENLCIKLSPSSIVHDLRGAREPCATWAYATPLRRSGERDNNPATRQRFATSRCCRRGGSRGLEAAPRTCAHRGLSSSLMGDDHGALCVGNPCNRERGAARDPASLGGQAVDDCTACQGNHSESSPRGRAPTRPAGCKTSARTCLHSELNTVDRSPSSAGLAGCSAAVLRRR